MKAGWEAKRLGAHCRFENGDRGKNYPGRKAFVSQGIPFINAGHIGEGFLELSEMNFIPRDHFERLGSGKINRGDLLFCLRGSLGKYAVVDNVDEGAIASSLVIVRPDKSLDARYLSYFFGSPLCAEEISLHANGAAQPNLSAKNLAAFKIPVPPTEEQKRIVAILDEAFEGLTRARAHIETNLQNAKDLFESGLDAAFEDSSTDFQIYKFGDREILSIIDGDRGANYPKKEDFYDMGYCLFLNTKNVRTNGFDFSSCIFIDERKDRALRKGKLKRRDVVLTTRGTIGNIAIFDESVPFDEIRINSGMLILRPNESMILAEYLFEVLRSRLVKRQISERTSGAAQPQLPIGTLVGITLPVPTSISVQKRIVKDLREIVVQTDILQSHYRAKLADLDALRQSLLQKAFAGELT